VIKVGAATETEMKEKKARVEDAMHATRAAVEEGIVPGGGVALVRCIAAIDKLPKLEGDEQIGANIVRRASKSLCARSSANAGEEGAIVVGKIRDSKDNSFGYNARPASSKTWSRPASSTRPRSPAPLCRTPAPSRR
jgi:chaperonin GroEL